MGLATAYRIILATMLFSLILLTIDAIVSLTLAFNLFGSTYILLTGLFIVWSTRTFASMPSLGISLDFLSLGIGQSIGSSMVGSLIEYSSFPAGFISFACIGLLGLAIPVKAQSRFSKPTHVTF